MLNYIVKRGVAHLQAAAPDYMARLQEDAQLYEKAGPAMEISPIETLPVLFTGIIVFLILASIRYTLGDVVASLAMIESPSTTAAIVEHKLPAYADEEPLIPTEADVDVEITVNRKPITASLCKTMRHLRSVGGFFARWRGLGISILYSIAYGLVSSILSGFLGALGHSVVSVLASLLLVRLHMLWTHTMIAHPPTKPLLQRIVPRAQCKPLILPTFVYAAAQQATFLVPLGVAYLLDLPSAPDAALRAAQKNDCAALASLALRILAVPLTAALIALFVLLPASATLTRIEAALLPADMQSIVAFDRAALVGNIDLTVRGSSRALFVAAWRSFDCAARVRMLKLYAKMVGAQIAVALVGMQIMAAEIYLIGGERLTVLFTSARAQLELMAIENQNGM
ncbi:hypothetical protein DFH08DRAFT_1088310 [Mycena albidolilacea]|uniref:Uncharacterized protein n=1 Tax=Mycena albidolilacea TaxID=1033008 RepID=A0AAD6Z672_9AGAR|nr:hypothetical protein DFH08DRAFT_1088310 [Mycena albidolilacea]